MIVQFTNHTTVHYKLVCKNALKEHFSNNLSFQMTDLTKIKRFLEKRLLNYLHQQRIIGFLIENCNFNDIVPRFEIKMPL